MTETMVVKLEQTSDNNKQQKMVIINKKCNNHR